MKRFLLLPLLLILTICDLCHAGYALYVSPQIPEFVTVNGPQGLQQWPNPQGALLHVDHYCNPADYSRFASETSRRTEVIRSATGTLTQAEVLAVCPKVLDAKYNRLWSCTSDWEKRNISGVALSLLSLGVSKSLPKSLAVAAWSSRLWNDTYYPRKALINLDTEPSCDFSAVGDMPYTVPELSLEVWGK